MIIFHAESAKTDLEHHPRGSEENRSSWSFVPSSLQCNHPSPFRGHIDCIDGLAGISGWALNLSAPNEPLCLQLMIDDRPVADYRTSEFRADLVPPEAEALAERPVRAGFHLQPSLLGGLKSIAAVKPNSRITIAVAGTVWRLPGRTPPPTLAEIFRPAPPPAACLERGKSYSDRFDALHPQALALLNLPLNPMAKNQQGYIETLAVAGSGHLWVTGWMTKGHPSALPMVIVERGKVPAILLLAGFERADLPDGTHAFIGLMRTDWRPNPQTNALFFFGGEAHFFLRNVLPARLVDVEESVGLLEGTAPKCGGHLTDLLRFLATQRDWTPFPAKVLAFPIEASVDQLLVVPRFGCFLEGWALSPVKSIQDVAIKLGNIISQSDRRSLYAKPRPDLAAVTPTAAALAGRAGLVAVLRGPVPVEEIVNPVMKLAYRDGSFSNHPVPIDRVRRLEDGDWEELLTLYPTIEAEPFFPDLARAIAHEVLDAAGCEPVCVQPARRVAIAALPGERCDVALLFDRLARWAGAAKPVGLAILADRSRHHGDVMALFQELAERSGAPSSLFLMENLHYAFYRIATILRLLGAERFLFLAPDIFPTAEGWQLAADSLTADASRLDLLGARPASSGLDPDGSDLIDGNTVLPGECFVWSSTPFATRTERVPGYVGGFHRDNGLRGEGALCRAHPGAARRSRSREVGRLAGLVNRFNQLDWAEAAP